MENGEYALIFLFVEFSLKVKNLFCLKRREDPINFIYFNFRC